MIFMNHDVYAVVFRSNSVFICTLSVVLRVVVCMLSPGPSGVNDGMKREVTMLFLC